MIQIKSNFMYSPGGENEGNATPEDEEKKDSGENGKPKEEKPFLKKIKDALQDWSNDDKRESDFDERSPIT